MKLVHEEQYEGKSAFGTMKWHEALKDAETTFKQMNHIDISTEDGMSALMSSESLRNDYNDIVAGLVTDDEERKEMLTSVMNHTMKDLRNHAPIRSNEGADAMGNNANYSSLARLNSWSIVGYTARSKALELFHTFSSDDPTVSFKYTLNYVVNGSDTKRYYSPRAERNGDLVGMYDMPQLLPSDNATFLAANTHLENDTDTESFNGGSTVWLKISGGVVSGNLFSDANNAWDRTKYTLEKNPQICGIKYSIPNPDDATKPFTGAMAVYLDREEGTGDQEIKHFYETVRIPYDNGTKEVSAEVFGKIGLDSADYSFSASPVITHIQLDVRLTNVANEYGTIRGGSHQIVESFSVDNHPYGTVPVVPEVADDFNIGGEGVSAVAYWTDRVTQSMANMRDMTMERELDKAYNKPIDQFKLFPMLGGWKSHLDFPVTARLPGGGDPYSWLKTGIKASLINHFINSEMDVFFEDGTPRQWYILGHEIDTNLIPDVTYSNWNGEGGVGGSNEKYGFAINGRAGISDSEGRKIRVIGSVYARHYKNTKTGQRIPMRAVMKSLSLEQPTTLYLPYSFRVYSGIMSEYSKRTGLIIAARDCIRVLLGVQSRIRLVKNSDNLYRDIVQDNTPSSLSFPTGSSTLTINAE